MQYARSSVDFTLKMKDLNRGGSKMANLLSKQCKFLHKRCVNPASWGFHATSSCWLDATSSREICTSEFVQPSEEHRTGRTRPCFLPFRCTASPIRGRPRPYMTSALFSDFDTPPVTVTNQLILFLSSAFWGPPSPTHVIYGSPLR